MIIMLTVLLRFAYSTADRVVTIPMILVSMQVFTDQIPCKRGPAMSHLYTPSQMFYCANGQYPVIHKRQVSSSSCEKTYIC